MIIYVHGVRLDPDKKSTAFSMIKKEYPNAVEFCWDNFSPRKAIDKLIDLIDNVDDGEEVILVGSSLGGFICEYVSRLRRVSLVLFNPSLNPSESLKKYKTFEDSSVIETYNYLEKGLSYGYGVAPRRIVICDGDSVVDHSYTKNYFGDKARIKVIANPNHFMDSDSYKEVSLAINSTIHELYE